MFAGYLDHIDNGQLFGWAWDSANPERRLLLDVYFDNIHVTTLTADRPRQDLADTGVGDGRYGFWLALPADLRALSCVVISVRFQANGHEISRSPRVHYRYDSGIDESFSRWVEHHATNLARSAARPAQLAPLTALFTTALSQLMEAGERLKAAGGNAPIKDLAPADMPEHLQLAFSRALARCEPLHVPVCAAPRLSIVMAGHETLDDCHACLKSILRSQDLRDYEIIQVDSSGMLDMALAPLLIRGGIRFLKLARPIPLAHAYAEGLKLARADRLLFLGPIAHAEPAAIRTLGATLDLFDGNALVSPRLMFNDGRIAEVGAALGAMGARSSRGLLEKGEASRFRLLRPSDDASLQAFMVSRAPLEAAGGFDHAPRLGELAVADLAFQMRKAGTPVLVQGVARVTLAPTQAPVVPGNAARTAFVQKWFDALPAAGQESLNPAPLRALMVTDTAPESGRDSASDIILGLGESLVRLGYTVSFSALEAQGMSARADEDLRLRGVEPVAAGVSAADALAQATGPLDLIVLHSRTVANALLASCRTLHPKAKIICEISDLTTILSGGEDGALAQEAPADSVGCDAIVVPAPVLSRRLREALPDRRIAGLFWRQPLATPVAAFEMRRNFGFLGGFRRGYNAQSARRLISDLWPALLERCPHARLDIAGSHIELAGLETPSTSVTLRGHVIRLAPFLAEIKVMLAPVQAPLALNGKVLASFAAGVPCVLSPLAAEGLDLPPDLADTLIGAQDDAFIEKARRLYTEADVWNAASRGVRAWAEQHLSRDALDQALRALLDDLPASDVVPEATGVPAAD